MSKPGWSICENCGEVMAHIDKWVEYEKLQSESNKLKHEIAQLRDKLGINPFGTKEEQHEQTDED